MSGALTHLSAGADLKFEALGPWAVERKFRSIGSAPSTVPFTILLLDRQYYLAAGACFLRHVRQVHHRDAAAKLSAVNISFQPKRESLSIHWIRIWRGGEPIELVETGADLELQQADSPDRLVAHLDIKDLRPDDAIDVAYTTTAREVDQVLCASHPIHQRVPMLDWNLSAIAPHDRPLAGNSSFDQLEANVRRLSEGSQFYHWHAKDLPVAERPPAHLPNWYHPSPELQLSTFQNWAEVAQEICRQWQIQPSGPEVTALAQTFQEDAAQDSLEAARIACRFIQEQVGNSPAGKLVSTAAETAASVIENREGSPQSKATLLVALLRSLGIPAAPVLVSRSYGQSLREALPTPTVFDHVIVRARCEDTDIWIDPTATDEAGPITAISLPPYGFGLQASPRTKGLCPIPKQPNRETNERSPSISP